MKRITIGNKEYTLEYTIEASLYDECTMSIMDMFVKAGFSEAYAQGGDAKSAMAEILNTMASLPRKVVTLFYAGLLEHHGPEGDGSVPSKDEAKKILVSYLKEQKKSYNDVYQELMNIITDDNFFDLIGLNDMLPTMEEKPKRGRKKKNPEDGVTTSEK